MADLIAAELDQVHERIAGRFARAEPRARVREYVSGLAAGLERKNGWTLAEWAGEVSPDGMQRLLRRADWDVDGFRDDIRGYVVEQLGDPDGVLIADDTGFLKKGTRTAGVQRQYSGTAGRTGNCQVGVFLGYASEHGHALIDRELYLPQSWAEEAGRRRAAGIPEDVEFTTKPRQALAMISGLDHYQVRSWRPWYAHITLSMLALAWLAASRAQARKKGAGTSDPGMIGYTLPEIRRLLNSLIQRYAPDPGRVWSWSRWRRRRQDPGPPLPLPAPRLRTHLSLQLHFARDPARG